MIEARGRNGRFIVETAGAWLLTSARGYVEIYSKSPHTKQAPVQLAGPPLEVVRLLRKLARELQAEYRNAKIQERKTNQ